MKLLIVILTMLCGQAFAQVPPPGKWATEAGVVQFMTGKHGSEFAGHRWVVWRYLDDNGFAYRSVIQVLRADKVLNLTPPAAGETSRDYLNRMWVAHSPLPCTDTAISSICDTARAELAKVDPPEPPAFVVAKNGTTLTRPVYRLDLKTMTVGELLAGKRAPVGVDCACWASGVRRNGTAMCAWASPAGDTRADEVTACSRK